MTGERPPNLTDAQVVEIVRRVVSRPDFFAKERCQEYFRALDWPLEDVVEVLLSECTVEELDEHGLDDDPSRQYYMAIFKIHAEGEPLPFYIKVAILLPNLESGYLLSFHL